MLGNGGRRKDFELLKSIVTKITHSRMKKFFRFGKKKKGVNADSASLASGSRAASRSGSIASETGVYVVRDKDLPKLHKAAWTGDLGKVKQLAKKNVNELDKSNR